MTTSVFKKWILGVALTVFFSGLQSRAEDQQIYIDVGQAKVKKSLLALPSFQYFGSAQNLANIKIGQDLFSTAFNDLQVADLFTFIGPESFLEDPSKTGLKPAPGEPNGFNFKNWTTVGAEFLIRAGYSVAGNKISLQTYVYYVPTAKLVFGKVYEGPVSAARKMAHSFCDDVMLNLTGKRGFFTTRFVVASDRSGQKSREIFVMDWDGANLLQISSHKSIAISPAWSPDSEKVAYTAFEYHPKNKMRNADLFLYELASGKRTLLSYRKGMNSGANFSPDGRSLFLTLSIRGSADIYKMSMDGKEITPLTKGPLNALNVEPNVDATGSKILFASDRSGSPAIYQMGTDGSGAARKIFRGKYNATPVWSPDGKKIAYALLDESHFDIFIQDENGQNLQRLTSAKKPNGKSANNEDPSFSPDGRFIAFVSDRTGSSQVYIVSIDGATERQITTDKFNYYKPKWSPYPK